MRLYLLEIDEDQASISLRFDLLSKSSGGCAPQPFHGADYDIQLKCDGRVQAQRRVDGSSRNGGHILRVSRLHNGKHSFQTRVRAVTDVKWSPWSPPMLVSLDGEGSAHTEWGTLRSVGDTLHEESNYSLTNSLREDSRDSIHGMRATAPSSVYLDSGVLNAGEQESVVIVQVSQVL